MLLFPVYENMWRTYCARLFFLLVVAFFFLLPLHSDPTGSIIAATFFGLLSVRKKSVPAGGARYALIFFTCYALITLVASSESFETLSKYLIVLLWSCSILVGVFFSQVFPDNKNIFYWAIMAGILVSFGISFFYGFNSPQFWHGDRLKLYAVHPSRLALYCGVSLLFCLYQILTEKRAVQWRMAVLIVILASCLYLTNTRGVILMLPLGIFCLVTALPPGKRKFFIGGFILSCLLAGAALWATQNTPLSKRVFSAVTDLRNDGTYLSRLPIWEAGWESFKKAPFIGHGVKKYSSLHAQYLVEHKEEWDQKYSGIYESRAKNAHNIVLGRLVESGAGGTLCFFIFYGIVILIALRLPLKQRWIAAIFVFYLGVGMLDDVIFRRNDTFIFLLAGTVLGTTTVNIMGKSRRGQ